MVVGDGVDGFVSGDIHPFEEEIGNESLIPDVVVVKLLRVDMPLSWLVVQFVYLQVGYEHFQQLSC